MLLFAARDVLMHANLNLCIFFLFFIRIWCVFQNSARFTASCADAQRYVQHGGIGFAKASLTSAPRRTAAMVNEQGRETSDHQHGEVLGPRIARRAMVGRGLLITACAATKSRHHATFVNLTPVWRLSGATSASVRILWSARFTT